MVKEVGLEQLLRNLTVLPDKLEKGTLRRGLKASAEVFREGAQRRVRKVSRKTEAAIKTRSTARSGYVEAKVQLRGEHSFVGWFLEFGVAPHFISGGDGLSARKLTQRLNQTGGADKRKPTKGFEAGKFAFMRPAMDEDRQKAVDAFISKVKADIVSRGYDLPFNEGDEE